jgi:hypothetical protein
VLDNANTQERTDNGGNVRHGQKRYFDSLDRGQKGYLSNDDVSADPFLAKNYPNCDADHDGKLTWPELRACTINNPPPRREALMPMRTAMSAIGEEPEARSLSTRCNFTVAPPAFGRACAAQRTRSGVARQHAGGDAADDARRIALRFAGGASRLGAAAIAAEPAARDAGASAFGPQSCRASALRCTGATKRVRSKNIYENRNAFSTQNVVAVQQPTVYEHADSVYPGSASSTMHWRGNAGSMRLAIRGCAWHTSARRAA